jgi:hypothetical protein
MKYDKWFMCKALVAALFISYAHTVGAAPVKWTFIDVTFADGTPVKGWFIYEGTFTVDQYQIQTFVNDEEGDVFHAYPSTEDSKSRVYENGIIWWDCPTNCDEGSADDYQLTLLLLDDLGPPNKIGLTEIGGVVESHRGMARQGQGGTIFGTPIPIPSTMLLLGTGLIGLGWVKFRRRKK